MPSFISPCCAKPSKRKVHQSKKSLNSTVQLPIGNRILNNVKLLDTSCDMSKFVGNCKGVVSEISKLPKGVNTTKMCHELTSMFDHFEGEVVSVIRKEIIPKVRSVGSTNYVHARLKHAATQGPLPLHHANVVVAFRHMEICRQA